MNKTKLIIIFLTSVLITLAGLLLALSSRKDETGIKPIPVFNQMSPSPTPISRTLNREEQLIAEQEYAKERERILTAKPWILKMPLRNEDYWLSYDTEFDVFDALIYVSPKFPRDEQIASKKQRIARDLSAIGVDVNKVKINYTEKEI